MKILKIGIGPKKPYGLSST